MVWRLAICSLALVSASSCAGTSVSRIFHPGSAAYQQREAEKLDPFPATEIGPDTAARPLAYIRPAWETERSQNEDTFEERFRQASPPGTYKPPRPPISRQQIIYDPNQPSIPQLAPPFTQ